MSGVGRFCGRSGESWGEVLVLQRKLPSLREGRPEAGEGELT